MPRPSSSAKRHPGAASSRDSRHEIGSVGPGKRVARNKSQVQGQNQNQNQGQLNGSAVEKAATSPSAAAADSSYSVSSSSVPPSPASAAAVANAPPSAYLLPDDMSSDRKLADGIRRGSLATTYSDSSADSLLDAHVPAAAHSVPEETTHRRIDVNDAKNTNVHRDPGPLDFAVTVLRACPLQDTIAILIILMQASPTVLATIYMLFTFLTFVPPVTTNSGLSITEIFDGSQGTPSLSTLIVMDFIMLGIWVFLWAPMQQFILDLAQVVISLTLGGGGTSNRGTTSNILLCVLIVGVSHWTHYSRWNGLSRVSSLFGSSRFLSSNDEPVRPLERKGTYGWVRSILAIHILTQGLVRCIREWYLRRERRDQQLQGLFDPEAGKLAAFSPDGCSDAALMAAESEAHLQANAAHLSSKKRRKQSAQVRVRQPLWAALASTKIVMVKEYELSHAASESAGSNATDIHNLGNAPFNTQPEQIWICYVGCDEVCFNTSHFPHQSDYGEIVTEDNKPGIDMSKPFYVRVNNAIWQPTRIIPLEDDEERKYQGTRWTGDIYGLTPLSNYEFEFVSTRTGEIIFSTSVRTIQAKNKDPETAPKTAPSNSRTLARHDSPVTTLRASIAAAELKLADERARLKAVRRENNRRLNAARKEIEKLTSAVQSAGGDDEKLRQKIAQNRIQEKRAEESISELETELKELETVPEELLAKHRASHDAWTSEKARFDQARANFKNFKQAIDKQIKALEEERASLQAKRNKIATRIAKVDDEHARITDANAKGLNEAERRRQERANLEAELARAEQNLRDRIQSIRSSNLNKQVQLHDMAAQMQAYLASFQDDLAAYDVAGHYPGASGQVGPWHSSAPAPTGAYPATSGPVGPWPPVTMAPSQYPFANSIQPSPALANSAPALNSTPPPQHRSRGRSSSMLSSVSGFTQSTDEDTDLGAIGSGRGAGTRAMATASVTATSNANSTASVNINITPGAVRSLPPGLFPPLLASGSGSVPGLLKTPGFGSTGSVGSVASTGSAFGSGSASVSGSGSGSGLGSGRSSVRSRGSGSGASLEGAEAVVGITSAAASAES